MASITTISAAKDAAKLIELEITLERTKTYLGIYTFFSNGATGYSGSMTIDNNTYEEAKASDCDVMGLFLDNCPEFSIGGIKTGSTIEEVNKTFGVNYTNECRTLTVHSQNGAFTDSKGTFTLTVVFAFDDGVVYSVGESKIYSTFF